MRSPNLLTISKDLGCADPYPKSIIKIQDAELVNTVYFRNLGIWISDNKFNRGDKENEQSYPTSQTATKLKQQHENSTHLLK